MSQNSIDPSLVQAVNREIYRRFPEVEGRKPRVQLHVHPSSERADKPLTFLLIYHGKITISESKTLPCWVRAVVDEKGKILKITTSR